MSQLNQLREEISEMKSFSKDPLKTLNTYSQKIKANMKVKLAKHLLSRSICKII